MNQLPKASELPAGLSIEKNAKNLAALATTGPLRGLMATVLAQWKHADTFARLAKHGIRPIDRMLFYGPPGNGKTMASQWLAQQLGATLYRVRCEALIEGYLGGTTSRVGDVMEWLETQSSRSVVLFDEVEQLFQSRSLSGGQCDHELNTAMSVFWQYLDRWESPTLFVLATNLRDQLDPALLSRIDLQLQFGPPTVEQSEKVIGYWVETLHEYGSDQWGPELLAAGQFESFRALFHAIQQRVREHVTNKG